MENLAYLHIAGAYEEPLSEEQLSLDWSRLSSRAWGYLLPLFVTLAVLSAVSSAFALERGDEGPSVRRLQQELRRAGFYQAPITQVYDAKTESAVRRFQKTAGLEANGIAEPSTVEKLRNWNPQRNQQARRSSTQNNQTVATRSRTENTQTQSQRTTTATSSEEKRNPNVLSRGDEGEKVKVLQERLRVSGHYFGNATGIFGPITEEAVKRFQEAYNLTADGVVGPETDRLLPPVGVGFGEESAAQRRNQDRDKLSLGDRGEPVRVLQQQLIQAGYLQGEPNGYFGPYTQEAVKRFQADNYLQASGIAGPTTRGKLHALVNKSSKSEFNVLEIQRRLRERGFYKGPLNGNLSDDTKRAIKQAQEFYGISLNDIRQQNF